MYDESKFGLIQGELTQAMFDEKEIHKYLSEKKIFFYTFENSETEGIKVLTIFEIDNA